MIKVKSMIMRNHIYVLNTQKKLNHIYQLYATKLFSLDVYATMSYPKFWPVRNFYSYFKVFIRIL